MHEAVFGSRDVLDLDLDLAVSARHLPQQKVRRIHPQVVAAVPLPHRQRVDNRRAACIRPVRRLQHHGAIEVTPGDRAHV